MFSLQEIPFGKNHVILDRMLTQGFLEVLMEPALTQFGTQMSRLSGVRAIMKDIIETLRAGGGQQFINLFHWW
ncbi:MAG TPA: hypothetical protein DD761_09165 [Cyanobacteria bacterium UBA11691]|nr:hypothetical protein [Cyanobacteria bacterium UBA11691]